MCKRTALALAALLLLIAAVGSQADAGSAKRKKTTTYLVTLQLDGRTVAGPFASTETVTASIVANPLATTDGSDPTAWEGEGTLSFGPITNTGLPAGCTLVNTPPSGTMKVALTRAGGSLEVNWSSNSDPMQAPVVTCKGYSGSMPGAPAVEPFAFLEPKQFTISAEGGSQQLNGKFDTGKGMMENTGTLTVTKRVECEPKVKEVKTYPEGQQTQLSQMAGRGFAPGEKLTADTNVEFVFPDGSIMRLAKGASYKENDTCNSNEDKSKSYKGTLLLGKIWFNVTKIFGQEAAFEPQCPLRCIVGVRGTKFWITPRRGSTSVSVSRGSVWFSRASKSGKLVGRKVIVKAGQTATMDKAGKITVRRLKSSDGFGFGAS